MKYNFDELTNRKNTNCYKYDLLEKYFGDKDLLPLWVADMDFKTPEFIIDAIKQRLDHEFLGYSFQSDSCFQSVIDWMKNKHQWMIEKDQIRFTPGVVPAINFAVMAFTKPGEKIIIQPPVYFPFFTAVKDHSRELVENPLKLVNGRYQMDFEHLKSVITPEVKMLILSSPHNPGGNVWTEEELIELADICIENHVIIFSDEIHSDLVFEGNTHVPLAKISKEISDITITAMAPSKTFNIAAMSTAIIIAENPKLLKTFGTELDKFHLGSGNVLGHHSLEAAYNHGAEWLDQLMDYLKNNLDYLKSYILENIPQIKIIDPEATYMAWLDFNAFNLSNSELDHVVKNVARLALSPGHLFGKEGNGFQRINFACPRKVLEIALQQLHDALKSEKLI